MINYSGIWQGEYRYNGVQDDLPVGFTLQIQHSLLTNKSWVKSGKIYWLVFRSRDHYGTGQTHEIEFFKYMPVMFVVDNNETVTLQEYWKKHFQIELIANPPHRPLLYQGYFEPHTGEMEGTWSFLNVLQVVYDVQGNSYDISGEEELTGTWKARRQSWVKWNYV